MKLAGPNRSKRAQREAQAPVVLLTERELKREQQSERSWVSRCDYNI